MVAQVEKSYCKYLLIFLGLVSVICNIVFICLNSGKVPKCQTTQQSWKYDHNDHGSVFADLSEDEYQQVRDFMWAQKDLEISRSAIAKPNENFIFLIEVALPKKADVLRFLDESASKPAREASVVVFYRARGYLKEYVVGPLGGSLTYRDVTEEKYSQPELKVTARPVTVGEYAKLFEFLYNEVTLKMEKIMKESFDGQPLLPFEGMPRGVKSGDRETWVSFFRFKSGMYIHPVGFEVLINHKSANFSEWYLKKVLYNGQYFDTIDDLNEAYDNGTVTKIVYEDIFNYASLKPRYKPTGIGPQQSYLQGKRFSVKGNQVMYMSWSFAFGLSSLTGMRAFDIRFKGERIAYELSVQEAMSVYGSVTPGMILTKFLDSSIGIGRFAHELVRGVDCPYGATYVDTYRYIDTNYTQRFRNSICVFEHDIGRPLRRHFSDFFHNKYGGMANSALIIRSITAIGNYDYVWDFIFYQSGSVEARVHATGYISSSYIIDGSLRHGHRVAENTLGNIHTHFINFKVDLDIMDVIYKEMMHMVFSGQIYYHQGLRVLWKRQGVKNIFQTKDMTFEEMALPWMPERKAKIPRLVENQLNTEQEAALRYGQPVPRYLHVASKQTNRWGHNRSYRIQVVSFAGDHLPESEPEERSMSWARYKVAITKYKDSEQTSSSLYSQNDMWSPAVDFSQFIADNESIVDEDLVAWITAGFLHIPHAEDIPNTVTIGNGGGVILRPHNYFDEDPSIYSPDGVFFEPGSENSCEYNKMACLKDDMCASPLEPFTYHGFEEVMKFE